MLQRHFDMDFNKYILLKCFVRIFIHSLGLYSMIFQVFLNTAKYYCKIFSKL